MDSPARLHGDRLDLTPTEYKVLYHLVRNAGHILEHGTLLAKVWGREYIDEVDYIRVYIRRLRNKLQDPSGSPRYIRTERGTGYLATLAAWLDHPGEPALAARSLHVHPNTLRYRMGRITALPELEGVDLGDPQARLALRLQLAVLGAAHQPAGR